MVGTFWAFVPAIVAIVLALVTKHVYVSLFVGIFTGAMFLAGGNPLDALANIVETMGANVGDSFNMGIIVFLVVLGIFVILMQKSGGAKAFGGWASKRIKTKKGAMGATAALGCLIFMDDYFNCLTVGSVMRPISDKYKVSRSKLAYLIDSTAAPVCILAPISSWAAAVSAYLDGTDISTFMSSIPFNVYAILTIVMVFVFIGFKFEFGKMRKDMLYAQRTGDVNAGEGDMEGGADQILEGSVHGRVRHLVVPIIILIVCCIFGMLYTGDVFNVGLIAAFENCDAGVGLAIGSLIALVITCIFYLATKVVSFKDMMESIPNGFKSMVPAILILVFAWTLSSIMGARGGGLDAKAFVSNNLEGSNFPMGICPFVFFAIACAIAFATGTSWGTFSILLPIAATLVGTTDSTLLIVTISAVLGGAVFGDHVSPISDTTIMASAGANCNHVNHVRTQLPYAGAVAAIAGVAYLPAGFMATSSLPAWLVCIIMWAIVAVMFIVFIIIVRKLNKKADLKDGFVETPEEPVE